MKRFSLPLEWLSQLKLLIIYFHYHALPVWPHHASSLRSFAVLVSPLVTNPSGIGVNSRHIFSWWLTLPK